MNSPTIYIVCRVLLEMWPPPVLGKCFHCRARFDGDFVSFCGFVQKIRNHQKMKNSPTNYTLFREVLELWMAPMAFSQTQRNAGCDFCGFAHKNGFHPTMMNSPNIYTLFWELTELWIVRMAFTQTKRNSMFLILGSYQQCQQHHHHQCQQH